MDATALLALARDKVNVTWEDPITDRQLLRCVQEAVPAVCAMVALPYDYSQGAPLQPNGQPFDLVAPSPERTLLLNWVAYEFNHKADLFQANYRDDINACRQRWTLAAAAQEEADAHGDDTESL